MGRKFFCQGGGGIALDRIKLSFAPELEELEEISVKPKSTDITLEIFGLAWMPFRRDAGGRLIPDWG